MGCDTMTTIKERKHVQTLEVSSEVDNLVLRAFHKLKEDIGGRVITAVLSAITTIILGGIIWIRTTGSDLITTVDTVEAHEKRIEVVEQSQHDLLIYFEALFNYMGLEVPILDH